MDEKRDPATDPHAGLHEFWSRADVLYCLVLVFPIKEAGGSILDFIFGPQKKLAFLMDALVRLVLIWFLFTS